jgi:hypothetical protein
VKRAARLENTRPRSWPGLLPGLFLVFGLGLFLLAITQAGKLTRDQVKDWDRFTIAVGDLQCPPPPFAQRDAFLAEVKDIAALPDPLQVLDKELAERLAAAFARHPYVEKVERVRVLPSREVNIDLVYRIPVLEVMLSDRPGSAAVSSPSSQPPAKTGLADDPSWYVDAKGIVLPRRTFPEPLPLLLTAGEPKGRPGEAWGDTSVEAAARLAALLRPQQSKLNLRVFEISKNGFVLSTPAGSHVFWGHVPGAEEATEAPAALKRDRLLDYCVQHGSLDRPGERCEHDVRPLREPIHRPQDLETGR